MPSLNDFLAAKPRPLPIIIAVDKSGSMASNGKIDALNYALNEFIDSLKEEDTKVDLQVALYSFGAATACCDLPLTSIDAISTMPSYEAAGKTPMGQAFGLIKELIEDKEKVSSRSYKPTIVLLTDGIPTDDYLTPMLQLIQEGRSSKAFRMAMAIGDDADKEMLGTFVSNPEFLVKGEDARDIRKFFKFVTMSVTSRLHSQTPDNPPILPYSEDEITL